MATATSLYQVTISNFANTSLKLNPVQRNLPHHPPTTHAFSKKKHHPVSDSLKLPPRILRILLTTQEIHCSFLLSPVWAEAGVPCCSFQPPKTGHHHQLDAKSLHPTCWWLVSVGNLLFCVVKGEVVIEVHVSYEKEYIYIYIIIQKYLKHISKLYQCIYRSEKEAET